MTPTEEILLRSGLDLDDMNHLIMALILVGTRIQAFLSVSPFFGRKAMARTVRLGLVLAMSIILVPQVFVVLQNNPVATNAFLGFVFKEMVIGLVLGMLVWMPARGIEFSGVLLDTQRGSTTAQDYDVIFSAQTTPTAIFFAQMFSGYFFAVGGFMMVQMLLFESFQVWPAVAPLPPLNEDAALLFIRFTGVLIFTSVVFALPISGFMFLADIAIAFVARSAPTLNALTFGMPVKSAILLIMLFAYMDIAFPKIMDVFADALILMGALFENDR